MFSWPRRRLTEFAPVCDICGKHVGFSDYGYMCKTCGDVYYVVLKWIPVPKFMMKALRGVIWFMKSLKTI
jgi:hypothetical protein